VASEVVAPRGVEASRRELVAALREAAPPGLARLDAHTLERLRVITTDLLRATANPLSALEEFERHRLRTLALPRPLLQSGIVGAKVMVTGGTGCIGSALLAEIAQLSPRRLVSLSRGKAHASQTLPSVEYHSADIRDRSALEDVFRHVAPDVVFHLAAQRDPGLAERAVVDSLTTNVLGTSNVLALSEAHGVQRFIYASTGKALRPYTPHIYAASKKLGELLTLTTSRRDTAGKYAVARFTHVVDNSLVIRRFRAVVTSDALGLHDPTTMFYTQSAREAAELLLCANAHACSGEDVEVFAIQDLGMPAQVLGIALGVIAESGGVGTIYVRGCEPGYEDSYYPGLYDPETAADVSPLLNVFEAEDVRSVDCTGVDASPIRIASPERIADGVAALPLARAAAGDDDRIRNSLSEVSFALLNASLDSVKPRTLQRVARLTSAHRAAMSEVDLVVDDCIRARIPAGANV
jgi:nucleoside-diphosphate-sugar epimerase